MKKIFLLLLMLFSITVSGQADSGHVEMADAMRSSGKIYVVVAVLCLIFAGIVLYLAMLDKKISRLEKKDAEKHN